MEIDQPPEPIAEPAQLLTRTRAVTLTPAHPGTPVVVRTERTLHDEATGIQTIEDICVQPLGCGHVVGFNGSALAGVCHACNATLCSSCSVKNACRRCKRLTCPSHGKSIRGRYWYCEECWWKFAMPQHTGIVSLKVSWFLLTVAAKVTYILVRDVFRILGFVFNVGAERNSR